MNGKSGDGLPPQEVYALPGVDVEQTVNVDSTARMLNRP
jgi:hypothetical protein